VIGDYMTEAVFPTIPHQDPRCFRRGTNRDVADGVSKLGSQPGVDMASHILKEFRADLERKFSHKQQ
jgi:hypothetical protein